MISIISYALTTSAFAQKKPVLSIQSDRIDMGKIIQYKPDIKIFDFTNTGEQPLQITAVKPTCGCTAADYTKTPVLPGKKGFIKVEYNAMIPGVFNKTITVESNSDPKIKILTITGEVVSKK